VAKRVTRKQGAKARPKAHIVITSIDDSPIYYANHIEVAHSPHEFELVFARLPAKISEEKMIELQTNGRLETEALARVVIPTSLMLDMIRVLDVQKGKYEEQIGPLLQPGAGKVKDE
jgi:Protein of unknown function (DUF3467)